ncbi:MAG TPA: hypothetical protein PLX97_05480 [Gemmatales bacterium]|nr:hypothetical protein [Gemmatales bacterium]
MNLTPLESQLHLWVVEGKSLADCLPLARKQFQLSVTSKNAGATSTGVPRSALAVPQTKNSTGFGNGGSTFSTNWKKR